MDFDLHQVDTLLSTTRAVRKRLDLDREVPDDVLLQCLRLAVQAPTGSNTQNWRWIVVRDPDKKAALADLYRRAGAGYLRQRRDEVDAESQLGRVIDSSVHLTEVLHRVPVMVVPAIIGRPGEQGWNAAALLGSVIPAMWSFQLALRSRGLGSCYTTLHLAYEDEARELLGIPERVTQAGLLPVAYTLGTDFKPAVRRPVEEITYFDTWKATR
jgi:nitroreductase